MKVTKKPGTLGEGGLGSHPSIPSHHPASASLLVAPPLTLTCPPTQPGSQLVGVVVVATAAVNVHGPVTMVPAPCTSLAAVATGNELASSWWWW